MKERLMRALAKRRRSGKDTQTHKLPVPKPEAPDIPSDSLPNVAPYLLTSFLT